MTRWHLQPNSPVRCLPSESDARGHFSGFALDPRLLPNMNIVAKSFEIWNVRPDNYEAYCAQLLDGANGEPLIAATDYCLTALQTIGDLRR